MNDTLTLALTWRPYFPTAVTLTGVAVLLALSVWSFTRSARHRPVLGMAMLVMRCVLVALIGLLLMGPSAEWPAGSSGARPVMRVLLDSSASMQTPDMDGMSRYDFAVKRWLASERLARLNEVYKVELYAFDESRRRVDSAAIEQPGESAATGAVSNIARAVRESIDRQPGGGAAVLLLSDGRDTLDAPMPSVGAMAWGWETPIYTVPLGGASLSRDVAVIAVPSQPYLFADEPGTITVRLMQSNADEDATVLHVEHGERHETFPIRFEGRGTAGVDVPVEHSEPGTYEYRVWAEPIAGEADGANNEQPVFIEVTAKRLRVLVLEGQPYWDTKFLSHALRKDTRIELTQVTQISRDKRETIVSRLGASTELPTTLDELGRFDVIVLGKAVEHVLDARTIELLPSYVSDRGGRLVFSRGRAYDDELYVERRVRESLALVEPVVFGEGQMRNQRIERDAAELMQPGFAPGAMRGLLDESSDGVELPELLNVPVVAREKAAARVLARVKPAGMGRGSSDQGQPAIVTMPYGRGMVVAVLGEGLWRWGLRPRRSDGPDNAYERFWMDTVRWLALGSEYQPGKPVSLQLSRLGVQAGDPISVDLVSRVGFKAGGAELIVESPDGRRSGAALTPVDGSTTRLRAVMHPKTPGVYRVTARSEQMPGEVLEAKFNCYDVDIERMHSAADRGAMRTLAETSGGRCLDPRDPDALPKILSRQREAMQSPPKPYYLWDQGWVMTALLSWAGLEWIIRRSGGLL